MSDSYSGARELTRWGHQLPSAHGELIYAGRQKMRCKPIHDDQASASILRLTIS
jgi:hypothetical protein